MAKTVNRLTAIAVDKIKKPGVYPDGAGLYLQVTGLGAKSWIYRYFRNGKTRQMGLGSLLGVSLADAREKAKQARKWRADGLDPIEARDNARAANSGITFRECVQAYFAAHGVGRCARNSEQWPRAFEAYVYPLIGDVSVSKIDTAAVLKAIDPIWRTKTETASRLRGFMEAVLDWAKVKGYRKGENPASWRGNLSHLLPARSKVRPKKHHAALPFADLPTFMDELRERTNVAGRAMEFCILTAARSGEIIGATWDEIDLDSAVWTIPGERMKAGREHRVPLAERAIEILKLLPRRSKYVFPGRLRAPLHRTTMAYMLSTMKDDITLHGFRSTFRDWAAETTDYPNHVVEMALAHSIGSAVEAAYRRGDLFAKRRQLMTDWADFCAGVQPAAPPESTTAASGVPLQT